jgi:DNA-binding CsgD family transcriptional regulator
MDGGKPHSKGRTPLPAKERACEKAFQELRRAIRKFHSWSSKALEPEPLDIDPRLLFRLQVQDAVYILMRGPAPEAHLTLLEEKIITWIASGLRDKEICQRLSMKEGTLATHEQRIRKKVGTDSRARLAFLAPFLCPRLWSMEQMGGRGPARGI